MRVFEPMTPAQQHYLQEDVALLRGEVNKITRLFFNPDGTISTSCPAPEERCAALETAEHLAKRIRYGRLWTALGSAAIMALGGLLVAITTALTGGQARAEGKAAAVHEIEQRSKSTESISYESARLGAIDGYHQCQKDLPVPALRIH
jgi:hypothetical protein